MTIRSIVTKVAIWPCAAVSAWYSIQFPKPLRARQSSQNYFWNLMYVCVFLFFFAFFALRLAGTTVEVIVLHWHKRCIRMLPLRSWECSWLRIPACVSMPAIQSKAYFIRVFLALCLSLLLLLNSALVAAGICRRDGEIPGLYLIPSHVSCCLARNTIYSDERGRQWQRKTERWWGNRLRHFFRFIPFVSWKKREHLKLTSINRDSASSLSGSAVSSSFIIL